jgi:hypothetical protein
MAPNSKIPSSLFIGYVAHSTLPGIPVLFLETEVLKKALPWKLLDWRIVSFTGKGAVGV